MTLAELGAQLREDRDNLGLTVEELAARLKIPARILLAIEEGGVDELPHTVYTRSFIKGYGLLLGYSNERITELVDSLEGFREDFSPPRTLESPVGMDGRPAGRRHGFGLVMKLLVIALLGAGGYAYYTHTYRDTGTPPEEPVFSAGRDVAPAPVGSLPPAGSPVSSPAASPMVSPAASSAPAGGAAPAEASGAAGDVAPASASGMAAGGAPTPVAAPLSVAGGASPPETLSASSRPESETADPTAGQETEADPVVTRGFAPLGPSTPPTEEPAPSVRQTPDLPAGMHQIVLTADSDCWVHANADNTDTRQFTLKTGETFAMPFRKSLVLKLGNAGGVKITYDGTAMPRPGASGQVKTITFPPQS